jgi:O-antigen/teichoic acid export membrane protein
MKDRNEMDQRLNLPVSARLLLIGNALLVAPAFWATVRVLNHLESRWRPLTVYRAPFLGLLMGTILISIVMTWRGSHRAANWMLILFSIFVGVSVWESAMTFATYERSGDDISEITLAGWWAICWGLLSFVWLGLNVWYFYGRDRRARGGSRDASMRIPGLTRP